MTQPQIFDTYFYLLENQGIHEFGTTALEIKHTSPEFNKDHYESQAQKSFASYRQAYDHWIKVGRQEGLEYSPGKNTKLKIILKAKDEPELIDKWIQHHGEMTGLHNIVILDCNSEDKGYLQKLHEYSRHVTVLKYPRYYDHIHNTEANRKFFSLIAKNSRYAAILDADEFLIWKDGQKIVRRQPVELLSKNTSIFCGTWLHNAHPPTQSNHSIDWSAPLAFRTSDPEIRSGTVAGKAIIRSDLLFKARHLGHNLHVQEVKDLTTPESFGKFLILHISDLGTEITKKRAIQHLLSKKAINKNDIEGTDFPKRLMEITTNQSLPPSIRSYAQRALNRNTKSSMEKCDTFLTQILSSTSEEPQPDLAKNIDTFNFNNIK